MKKISRRHRPGWAVCLLALGCLGASAALPVGDGVERGPARRALAARAAMPVVAEREARVIVKFRSDSALAQAPVGGRAEAKRAQALSKRMGLALNDGRPLGERTQVIKGRGLTSQQLAERVAAQGDVEYAVVDGRVRALAAPNDPLYGAGQSGPMPAVGQWYLRAPTGAAIVNAESVVSAINAEAAWDVTTGSTSIVVAVLDTGVRFDHPDLAGKLLPGYDFIHEAETANDGNGRDKNASDPGDFVTADDVDDVPGCEEGGVEDSSWHGTQTAGLIGAATNNKIGMAGAGYNVKVLPLRVLGKCGGYDSDIQAAMRWAAGIGSTPSVNPNPAKVINLSLGATGTCSAAYQDAIAQVNAKNVVVVVSAGNDGLTVGTPANCPGAIAVAGVRHAGTKVGYSDLGSSVTIAAPAGNCVNDAGGPCLFPLLSTSNSGTTTPVAGAAGAVYTGSGANAALGTSFSAPLVSGAVALMFSANRSLTSAEVKAALQSTARAFPSTGAPPVRRTSDGPLLPVSACTAPTSDAQDYECYCTTGTCGAGLLDVAAALAKVAVTTANPNVASTSVTAGKAVTLDGRPSTAKTGATITSYVWSIPPGTTIATLTSDGPAATLQTTGAGSVDVSLTVVDSDGGTSTNSVALDVNAPAGTDTPGSSGGGGGGALGFGWLLAWLAALVTVRAVTPRRPG